MKSSNKSSFITGIVLIAIAALFTLSLLILPLGYNFGNIGSSNIFFIIGDMIFGAYGFSSIIIPVFLLVSGLSCFTSIWTSQKTMRLITAIIPFFTAVVTEKICRSILAMGKDSAKLVEVFISIIIGAILIVIEYIAAGLVAEKINQKLFHSPKKVKLHQLSEEAEDVAYSTIEYPDGSTEIINLNKVDDEEIEEEPVTEVQETEIQESEEIEEPVLEETPAEPEKPVNVFEEALEKNRVIVEPVKETVEEPKKTSLFDEALAGVTPAPITVQEDEAPVTPETPAETQAESENEYSNNPASVITVEEYAALIQSESEPEEEEEELEWTNLPPKPAVLPPEYTDEIEEDSEVQEDNEETDEYEDTISPDFYDVDMTTEETTDTEDEEYAEDDDYVEDEEEIDIEKSAPAINFGSAAASAFGMMDEDIEKEIPSAPVNNVAAQAPKTNKYGKKGPYIIPTDLLTAYKDDQYWVIDDATKQASINLKQTLSEFNIDAQIIGIKKGPVVTMFELLPAPGVKLSKIVALQDNIALSLAASSVRIVAPIPGKQAVGIEVPNKKRSVVGFRELIEMKLPEWDNMAVPVILGKDILGKAQLIDLVKTPHMLIAGATGSGKSVCVNSLILSILFKRSYRDVKLILVDPKVVELKLYNNIPHLLTPVITEPKKALQALQYCLCEMERRYALLDSMGVRDISSYNQRIKEREIATEKLPYIVVIIDEFADLMATSGKELESIVARLTAMSRAVGIHLVLATQRPSVNVITGLIKANIPSRIAFMVASRTDSNIIIDSVGAEKLLGRGDMLYASAVDPNPVRIQGTFVSDQEVEDVVNAVKEYGEPDYIDDEIFIDDEEEGGGEGLDLFGNPYDEDPLYDQALEIVVQAGKASASYIQRRLKIGYNRAARLVEEMEERGIVGPANGSKPREIIHMP
ncbi:MAG: DNA translocase FtsK [Treponema sp.]|nr:DNA translocase FtsK [Treponema sp.]